MPLGTQMTTTGPSSRMRLNDLLVVDVDIHPLDRPRDVAKYCDPPWRQVLEEGQHVPPYPAPRQTHPVFPAQYRFQERRAPTPQRMRQDLDDLGIDLGVLFAQGFHQIAMQTNLEYVRALTVAHNRWQFEGYVAGQRGLYGLVGVAPQDPELSAREIEKYAGEEKVCGVMMPAQRLDPLWGDRRFDPIYETAQRFDLPLLFHGGGTIQLALPFDLRQFDSPLMYHTFTHNIQMMATAANLLATGVPVRYPKLSFVFIEAGLGFAAHLMMALDRSWEDRRGDVPFLEEPPSFYMRRQMYYGTQPIEEPENPRNLAELIRIVGEDNVMYASDWPHHDFDHPRKVFDIPVSPETKRKVMGETALRVLQIPFERAAAERVPGKTFESAS